MELRLLQDGVDVIWSPSCALVEQLHIISRSHVLCDGSIISMSHVVCDGSGPGLVIPM
jgi:hypothetical protein